MNIMIYEMYLFECELISSTSAIFGCLERSLFHHSFMLIMFTDAFLFETHVSVSYK